MQREKITSIIYKNSSDCSEGLNIKFENINKLIDLLCEVEEEIKVVEPVKQDYEIQSFKNGKGDIFEKTDKGNFTTYNSENTYSLDRMIEGIQVYATTIHSVKRLTDGEVFTVGDKIEFNGTIGSFYIDRNNLMGINAGRTLQLEDAVKVKQPTILLATEDGKTITDKKENVYILNTDGFWTRELQFSSIIFSLPNRKYFSTEAAMDEYILQNKPITVTLKEWFASPLNHKDFFKSKQNNTI